MTSERIKEIQEQTAYPESVSVMLALKQVWNECEQQKLRKEVKHSCGSKLTDKEVFYEYCLACGEHVY